MIRFLLLLLLLPGAELVANNTDAVESFTSTTLWAQFIMAVTPKTMLQKPLPASHGPANKTAVTYPPPLKDGKKQDSSLKDISAKPTKVQLVQGGANMSDTNSSHYQQRNSTPHESQLNSTKMPVTARNPLLSNPPQKRPVIRKGPTAPSKAKTVPKFPIKNPSARYQSLPYSHHKNITSKPITSELKDSNFTAGSTGLSVSPIPQRTATTPLRNTFKPGQKGKPFPPDRVKQFPVALQTVTQMGRQLKEKTSNTSVLLNTLINQNSSFIRNSLQHMAQSSNSTFTTGKKESALYELNSLNTQNHQLNSENVTFMPQADQHNDVSRAGLDILSSQSTRTSGNVSHSRDHSRGFVEAATEVQSRVMTGVATQPKKDKDQTQLGMTRGHQLHHNQTHSHKHKHQVLETLNQAETNTISQHKDRTASSEPNRHHQKHQHNHTQPHSHGHHKHGSDHHLQRHHVSQTLVHLNTQEQLDLTSQIKPNQSAVQQLHTELVTSTQMRISTQNDYITKLSIPSYIGAMQESETGSVTADGLSEISGTAHPSLTTQTVLNINPELTTQTQEPSTHFLISVTNGQTSAHKLNTVDQGRQSDTYSSLHSKPIIHKHPELHTRHNLTETTKYNVTTQHPLSVTKEPQFELTPSTIDERFSQVQSGTRSSPEQLTIPTQEHKTIKQQPDISFLGLREVNASEVGLFVQTQPRVNTQTLPHLGTQAQSELSTERNLFTTVWSVMSTKEPPNLTMKSPTMPNVTATIPYPITQSQPEPTRKNHPNSRTLVYVNRTQPESFTDSHSKGNVPNLTTQNRTESSTSPEPITNNALESTYQTKPISKGPVNLINYTEPIADTNSHKQTELSTKTRPVYQTMSELITQVTTESTNNTKPILQGGTKADPWTEPVTRSRAESAAQSEPEPKRYSSTRPSPATASGTHPTTIPEWVIDGTDTHKQTKPTTIPHTEPNTQTEQITSREAGSNTESESTTDQTTDLTNADPISRHVAEADTEKEPTTENKTESFTRTGIAIHSRDETEPAIQIKTELTNQAETISKTLKPAIPYSHVPTTHKGLILSTQSDAGTLTYHQSITWTGLELTMNANKEASMQTPGDQAGDLYTPTERTIFTKHVTLPEFRTEGSVPSGSDHGFTEHGIRYSKTTVASDIEAHHPASRIPSETYHNQGTTEKNYGSESSSSTKPVTSPQSFTSQTPNEMMSSPSGTDRIFIVDEQQPVFKVPTFIVTYKVNVQRSSVCSDPESCKKRFGTEVTSAYRYTAGFEGADVRNVTLVGTALEYKVQFTVRVGSPMSMEQELLLANPMSVFEALAPSEYALLSAIHNTSLADMAEPCTEWLSCPRGFGCVPQRKLSAYCLSPCHSTFCQNDGICIHRKGQEPACQCPVGRDFWYMGPACDYRMTHHRLAAIACAVVFCVIICAAAAVFILVRRFQTQILQQKAAQTQSSYRRFSRFDDVPTHFWCPSQTWLTTSASINSLDNPAFSSSEEVFPLQALGSCVCGCQDGARNNTPANPAQQPSQAPPRLETSCSSVNDLMVDSGKASDVSVCSWPMEPIHWTPFPILHQLSLQSPFHARRPHSYFEGMELVNTERSWTA